MEIKYVGHACVLLRSEKERVLVDPWFVPSLNGETLHAVPPPAKLSAEETAELTAIHISHIHSDHFCETTLRSLPKNLPVIIAKHSDGVLAGRIKALGFERVIEVEVGPAGLILGDLRQSLFVPARGAPYDSSLVVTCAGRSYLFDNDARFSSDHYFLLGNFFPCFEAAFVGYADIYPFPLIYDFSLCRDFNSTDLSERTLVYTEEQAWRRIETICEYLRPKWVCPYAASIRFRHQELLHFNRMFFAKAGILERKLFDAIPVALMHGDVVKPGEVPSTIRSKFDEPSFEAIHEPRNEGELAKQIGDGSERMRAKLRDMLQEIARGWSSQIRISFEVHHAGDAMLKFGYFFDGNQVRDFDSKDSESDISIRCEPGVAGKILFDGWSLRKASYSYRMNVVVRRIVSGQIAIHRWS